MLALLCGCLLLAAGSAQNLSSLNPVELRPDLTEQIQDMHAKVTDIWQEVTQRRVAASRSSAALHAVCNVQPSATLDAEQPQVTGLVLFRQSAPEARLEAFFNLEGFPKESNNSKCAIHVHQFGDLNQGCDSTGPHYNPLSVLHPQHPGDFGNFIVRDGRIRKHQASLPASLAGPHSIVGRAVVVHAGEDDLGRGDNPASVQNGNAGPRLACCVVGTAGAEAWTSQAREHMQRKKRRRDSECKTATA